MREIKEILGEVFSGEEAERIKNLQEVKRAWAGLRCSGLGEPCGFKGNRLVIRVGSHVWAQELVFYKEEIVRALEEATRTKIEDLIFKVKP